MITRAPRIPKKVQDHIFDCFVADLTAVQTVLLAQKRAKKLGKSWRVSRPCVNRWFRHYRELIYKATERAPRFEGEVEIDIGFFAGRASKYTSAYVRRLAGLDAGRIVAKRKEIRKEAAKKQMVLGFLRRHGDIYLLPINTKSRTQLEAAVRLVVVPGSIVYSDMEKGLDRIRLDGYTHHQINHALGYVDQKGNHINGIESFWRETRRSMGKNFRGVPRSTLMLHIKEREFRYNNKDVASALEKLL